MKIAILSDIHANLTALDAVLTDAEHRGALDGLWVAGDSIGYGPDPNECLDVLKARSAVAVAGNHELAAVGKISTEEFNTYAAAAAQWTSATLTQENIDYVSRLQLQTEIGGFTLVHGSPRDPVWEYLLTEQAAIANLEHFTSAGCVIGHSHMQFMVKIKDGQCESYSGNDPTEIFLDSDRYYVNPGSVGQPRDGDPRAAYAIYDDEAKKVTFRRVEYAIGEAQKRMEAVGLPLPLIQRIAFGR